MSSDTSTTPQSGTMRRRGPAARRNIVTDGVEWLPRDKLADEIGISHQTGARKFKRVAYVGGVAIVPREASLRDLVTPDPKPRTTPRLKEEANVSES
jgi:hypothetical protein